MSCCPIEVAIGSLYRRCVGISSVAPATEVVQYVKVPVGAILNTVPAPNVPPDLVVP